MPPAPITVNFHPDRLVADGRTVAECLAADGVYRSQFETGISNGGLGGDRERRENRMFGGAYRTPAGRPIYGALNLARHPDGASPRFGSCHLVLRPSVADRATFSHGDSFTEPAVVGTADTFGAIWRALLDQVTVTGQALGVPADSPAGWVAALGAYRTAAGRTLDDYVEAQIHGGLTLSDEVTAVVADPSLRGTGCEALLRSLGPPLSWAPGFSLRPDQVPADVRGPSLPPFAAHLASRYDAATIDAALIGRAARSAVRHPAAWSASGPPAEVLQSLKYLWHILVLDGRPVT